MEVHLLGMGCVVVLLRMQNGLLVEGRAQLAVRDLFELTLALPN
jgi:hypothetical protein